MPFWLLHLPVPMRSLYPDKCILATKIDYKLAYRRGHLYCSTALPTCTQFPGNNQAIITPYLTFGGALCLYKWGVISETICDLANELIYSNEWDPLILYALVQNQFLPREYLLDNLPFGKAHKLIIDVPVDPHGSINCYIDDTPGLCPERFAWEGVKRGELCFLCKEWEACLNNFPVWKL
jgi:hypothetical protein